MPDVRLIDANALLRKLQEQQKYASVSDSRGRAKAILEVIDAPAIDAQPVKHGRWVLAASGELYCSICEYVPQWDDDKFCANCGAKMDGGSE